jgi:hypothetical protein
MNKKKIEIIDIKLDIDIAEEIKSKVDSLNSEIIEHTKEVVKQKGMKIQRINKKAKARKERDERVAAVVNLLEKAFEIPDQWIEGKVLLEAVGVEATPQVVNKLSLQIRKFLEKEDKWTLSKKRRMNKTVYRLTRFS